jgi:carboxyl-terminal processing protease
VVVVTDRRSLRRLAVVVAALAVVVATVPAPSSAQGTSETIPVAVSPTTAPAETAPTTAATTTSTTPGNATPAAAVALTPQQYVDYAVAAIERYAYKRNTVDWPSIKSRVLAATAAATTYAETHGAITEMVRSLGDRHSSFTAPVAAAKQSSGKVDSFGFLASWPSRLVVTVTPGGPAAAAGMKVGDRIDKVDGKPPKYTTTAVAIPRDKDGLLPKSVTITWVRTAVKKPITKTLTLGEVTLISVPQTAPVPTIPGVNAQSIGRLAYLDVPGIIADPTGLSLFATQLQQQIRDLESITPRCAWIVDLRKNRGGYIHSLLAGLGPLTEGGTGRAVGGKRNSDGTTEDWIYRDGTSYTNDRKEVSAQISFPLPGGLVPVAVLTSKLTASAGEAVVVAFRGRPNTRSFGEATTGIPTFNVRVRMADGAFLDIMQGVDVDRLGQTYDGPITPDEVVPIDWKTIGTADDPVLGAAVRWLSTQGSCPA